MLDFSKFYSGLSEETKLYARKLFVEQNIERRMMVLIASRDFDAFDKLISDFTNELMTYEINLPSPNTKDDVRESILGDTHEHQDEAEISDSQETEDSCASEEDKEKDSIVTTIFRDLEGLTLNDAEEDGKCIVHNSQVRWLREYAEAHVDELSKVDRYGKSKFNYAEELLDDIWSECLFESEREVVNEFKFERGRILINVPHVRANQEYVEFIQTLIQVNYNLHAVVTNDPKLFYGDDTKKPMPKTGMYISISYK